MNSGLKSDFFLLFIWDSWWIYLLLNVFEVIIINNKEIKVNIVLLLVLIFWVIKIFIKYVEKVVIKVIVIYLKG